jgi:hypothetical protein
VLDYGVDGDQPFIAMELLEGETLAQRLHRLGRLAPSEGLRIVTHIARAVTRAHESNIVHRDLKPDNVFLVRNEDEEVAKVLDFGVAKIKNPEWLEESTQTRTGSLIGTPHYMSPEQVQGNKTVDYRSDLWSMGVIAFEMFTGQRPFVGNALGDLVLQICVRELPIPSRLAPVPAGFDEWFANAAERDPERRFQSARDLAAALREVVGTERDLDLVVADDFDPLRVATTEGGPLTTQQAADGVEAAAPIAFAKTMLGEPTRPGLSTKPPDQPSPPNFDTGVARDPTGERRLGLIVFVAMAAFIMVIVAIGSVLRSKSRTTIRRSEATPSAAAATQSTSAAPSATAVDEHDVAATATSRTPVRASADARTPEATRGAAHPPVPRSRKALTPTPRKSVRAVGATAASAETTPSTTQSSHITGTEAPSAPSASN